MIVLDASAALSVLQSQSTPASRAFLAEHASGRFVVPHIFTWEVVNVLLRFRRRGLLTARGYAQALDDIAAFGVEAQPAPTSQEVIALGDRAMALDLRPFDAAYLALAMELDCPLASRDERLLSAAARHIRCFDLRGDQLP